jgi:hypothetical protein
VTTWSASLTNLNFHDENDTTGQTWTLNDNDLILAGSVAVSGSATTNYNPGTGPDNTVNVNSTLAGSVLDLTGGAFPDTVVIGPNIFGQVNIDEPPGSTNLVIDLSTDGLPHVLDLSSNGTTSTLHDELGNLPHDITCTTSALASLTIDTDAAFNQTLNLDFGEGGNPIPTAGMPGLIFNAGNPAAGASHTMNIFGELPSGPFASETHNANDQSVFPQVGQYGSIFFTDASGTNTSLDYTGLQPITDTSPAVDYTFNDFGYPDQSFSATTGPIVGGLQTIEFANTPTPPTPLNFETTDIANKNFVTFNTPPAVPNVPNNGLIGTVNIPVPSDGLTSLTFNTPNGGTNNVAFVNTPPGVVTSYFDGAGNAATSVTGLGVPSGNVLFLNGGAGHNTLTYDAGGEVPPSPRDCSPAKS